MEEQSTVQTYQTLYLILAILGVISCVPLFLYGTIGLGLIVMGLSIYLLVKLPKGKRRTGALLLVIASALEVAFWVILVATVGSLAAMSDLASEASKLTDSQAITMVGGILGALLVAFVSWVIRIIGVIFSFIAYGREKQLDFDQHTEE
ncbi:hypothetical protein [Lacticaseibacillus absianus]|uniref:hypothetical protein n=1 Tax=Lacticaseibacillus absianus TaxID=2729623 RepID=UPI0015C83972|nr:hypothetical protein [Lacticaseibacillus absianus]